MDLTRCKHCGAYGGEHHKNCPSLPKTEVRMQVCAGCLALLPMHSLARLGRHRNSPLFCRSCAQDAVEQLKKRLLNPFEAFGSKEFVKPK